jgi:hypothetical protein
MIVKSSIHPLNSITSNLLHSAPLARIFKRLEISFTLHLAVVAVLAYNRDHPKMLFYLLRSLRFSCKAGATRMTER